MVVPPSLFFIFLSNPNNLMEEATLEIRNAIHLALSIDDANSNIEQHRSEHRGEDELLPPNNDASSSGTTSYVSSLSGSLLPPSNRPNETMMHLALSSRRGRLDDVGGHGNDRHAWQTRRLHAASRVENAASNYELALYEHHHRHGEFPRTVRESRKDDDDGCVFAGEQEDTIVDLLVALLTSVARTLQQAEYSPSGAEICNPQQEMDYVSSMEQICLSFACIASDVLRKVLYRGINDAHVYDITDEVVLICNSDPSIRASSNLEPILKLLNSLSELHDLEILMYEREHGTSNDDVRTLFSHLLSKETLRLIHILMHRILRDHENQCAVDAFDHIGHFVGYLFRHFAIIVREELGYDSYDEFTADSFEAWALGIDENIMQRLNEDEMKDIHEMILRLHVVCIQSTLHIIENAESVIRRNITQSEDNDNDNIANGAPESIMVVMRNAVRHIMMEVNIAEMMDRLGLETPEVHVIFQLLLALLARFTVSCLHDALHFLRDACDSTQDVENVTMLADDLQLRLCRVTIGQQALNDLSWHEADNVLALSLLRAINSPSFVGKSKFLLDIAANRAQATDTEVLKGLGESTAKRRCIASRSVGERLPEERRGGDVMDVVLACLALTTFNHDNNDPDIVSAKQVSCLTSTLMFTQKDTLGDKTRHRTLIDPLNPWHTLQVKALQQSTSLLLDDNGILDDATSAYVNATPHLLNIKPLSYKQI